MSTTTEVIRRVFPQLYKHLPLQHELSTCSRQQFSEGTVLLEEGSFVRYVPLVLSGLVKVYQVDQEGQEVLLYYIKEGESCIMSATYCIQQNASSIKAVVEEKADIILVSAKQVVDFHAAYAGWNEFLFSLFKHKFDDLLHIITILTFSRKDHRLLDYLAQEARLKGSHTLSLTHQQIADDLGTSREVVSRLLKKLEHEGKLTLKHRQLILKQDKIG